MSISIRRPVGFTIVELLVVIAIIGILIGMLMPAVQQARETGRRSQCTNNLKQIGLGYMCYESAYQAFPPSGIQPPWPDYLTPPDFGIIKYPPVGWGMFILPYIEQKSLHDKYDYKKPFYDGYDSTSIDNDVRNQRVANTAVETFLCSSAPRRSPYEYTLYAPMCWRASAADYSPIARVSMLLAKVIWPKTPDWDENDTKDVAKLAGVLEANKSVPNNVIKDGTSHTLLVAEIAGKNDLWQNGKNTGQKLPYGLAGQGGWADTTSANSVFFGSSEDGTTPSGTFGINASNEYGLYAFHRTIAHALFADGSVKALVEDIDMRLLASFITRAGGELETLDTTTP